MPLTIGTYDQEKLAALKALGSKIHIGEVVGIGWGEPDRTIYYGSRKLEELPNFRSVSKYIPYVDLRFTGPSFENVVLAADVADEKVNLVFDDLDGEITRLFRAHGPGVRVEFFYYFPQIDYFVSHAWFHLQPPSDADLEYFKTSAASGFRSAQANIPWRIHAQLCQELFPPAAPLLTQALIDRTNCGYNRHIGGGVGLLNPVTGQPFTTCELTKAACIARHGDALRRTAIDTTVQAVVVSQSGGHPALLASSRGNESNLKDPVRLQYGPRIVRQLPVLAYRQEHNTNHPDQGFLAGIMEVGEGTLQSMTECSMNNALVGQAHLNTRLGAPRQPPTAYAPDVSNFNRTAHFFGRIGPLNPGGYSASNITGQCRVEGICDMRVYTAPDIYTERYWDKAGWCIFDMYTRWRYGHGLDYERFVIEDWIALAAWDAETVSFTDYRGKVWTSVRNAFSADLQGRSAQAQLRDACMFNRYTQPFQHLGKLRILPLKKEPLDDVPVFTDEGPEQNIKREELPDGRVGKSLISWWETPDIPNLFNFNFEDAANGNIQRPLTFGREKDQRAAGEAFGDKTLRVLPRPYSAWCIVNEAQAVRTAWVLYYLGEFDEGGQLNNFTVKMVTGFAAGFPLYQSQVIKIVSEVVRRGSMGIPGPGKYFQYFRVKKKNRLPDLSYEVICQAYPEEFYETLETIVPTPEEGYEAESEANTLTGGAVAEEDEGCSGGAKVTGLGLGGTLRFNGITVSSTGLHEITVVYKSAVARTGYVSFNGGAAQPLDFPTAETLGVVTFRRHMATLTTYTITFLNPTALMPDLDVIFLARVPIGPPDDPPDDPSDPVCSARIGEVTYVDGQLRIPVLPCV